MTYYKGIKLVGNSFLLLCTLALVLSAGTAIYLSKQPNFQSKLNSEKNSTFSLPDQNLLPKSYTNKKYGYSFKYPSNVTSKEVQDKVYLEWISSDQGNNNGQVFVVDNKENLSPTLYAEKKLCEAASANNKAFCLKELEGSIGPWGGSSVNGVTAIYNLFEVPMKAFIFPLNNKIVRFEFYGDTGVSAEELDSSTIQSIVSTFASKK
ncbi:hypothetical protein HY045_00145 [Candidatus Woesebacteria bacterium]|nr:hypothetical protein [Candidatus Woesebacteria bacterium]